MVVHCTCSKKKYQKCYIMLLFDIIFRWNWRVFGRQRTWAIVQGQVLCFSCSSFLMWLFLCALLKHALHLPSFAWKCKRNYMHSTSYLLKDFISFNLKWLHSKSLILIKYDLKLPWYISFEWKRNKTFLGLFFWSCWKALLLL